MLDRLFSPTSIAVIGASKTVGKVGYETVNNLVRSGFEGPIVPVNSAGGELFGLGSRAVPHRREQPGAREIARHRRAHGAETDHADFDGFI